MDAKANLAGFLGLLKRGGKLLVGPAIWKELGSLPLILIPLGPYSGESLRLQKKIASANAPSLVLPFTKEELGEALGLDQVAFLAVKDKKAAASVRKKALALKGEL